MRRRGSSHLFWALICNWPAAAPFATIARMVSTLKNKWVLITGASSGFGAAAAVAFAREGARLLLGARRLDRLNEVAAKCRDVGAGAAEVQRLDVASTPS